MYIPPLPILIALLLSRSRSNASPLSLSLSLTDTEEKHAKDVVVKVVTAMNPLPHPEGTQPCGTYAATATDGPCGAWWMSLHSESVWATVTVTEAAEVDVVTVTGT
ncbi:MAG: hypothetical protein LQ348_007308 [Seirophora lacunosa]|nr:MAG: hypothetical protein LQ348_007308 [Seirophora lacunosa]